MAQSCAICEKDQDEKYRPFCSKRCADIDLGRWFDGTYTMAEDETSGDDVSLDDTPGPAEH